jgi:carbon-monoxide dehydrogenase small subunit
MHVQLTVNGRARTLDVAPNTLLVQALREHLKLTGTHVGCDTAQCGACTVIVDGQAVKSCNVLAAQVAGSSVTTIEGLAKADGTMHPMQAAFKDCHGLQCGFCTTGMVMSAVDLCKRHRRPTKARSASSSKATSAAAPGTRTSCVPWSRAVRPWPRPEPGDTPWVHPTSPSSRTSASRSSARKTTAS